MCLYCWRQEEMFCTLNQYIMKPTFCVSVSYLTVLYCWQLYVCQQNYKGRHCSFSIAKIVTRTRHNVNVTRTSPVFLYVPSGYYQNTWRFARTVFMRIVLVFRLINRRWKAGPCSVKWCVSCDAGTQFLGEFAKLRRAIISFVVSVRQQLYSH